MSSTKSWACNLRSLAGKPPVGKGGAAIKRIRAAALALALCLLTTGCAGLLDRQYASLSVHSAAPTAEGDPSTLRVESYQELVNALLYLVTQGAETGRVRLYNYLLHQAEEDLAAACLEVVQEDPLGAYSVDTIQFDLSTIVSCFEADLRIDYRRSREQVAAIVSATGDSAIRRELQAALDAFSGEAVLRVGYFDGGQEDIRALIKEAYFAIPESALDLPDARIEIYPQRGTRKIVEVLLDYRLDPEALDARREELARRAEELLLAVPPALEGREAILALADLVLERDEGEGPQGSTAYHALVEGGADSQGQALAMALLCRRLGISCLVVEGEREGEVRFWNVVSTPEGYRHLDLSLLPGSGRPSPEEGTPFSAQEDQLPLSSFLTDWELSRREYSWNTETVPRCGQPLA